MTTPQQYADIAHTAIAELNSMVAVHEAKAEIAAMVGEKQRADDQRRVRLRMGQPRQVPPAPEGYNYVFHGPPGTGKTATACLLTDIMFGQKMIDKRQLVEVSAAEHVAAATVDDAEATTTALFRQAAGGVLLIEDVRYLCAIDPDDRGATSEIVRRNFVDKLLIFMETNRATSRVIIAGYRCDTEKFLASHPGLKSRFGRHIHFPSFSSAELGQIAHGMADRRTPRLTFTPEALARLIDRCGVLSQDAPARDGKLCDYMGNARLMRLFLDETFLSICRRQAALIESDDAGTNSDSWPVTACDVDEAFDSITSALV